MIYRRGAIAKDPNAETVFGFDPGVADAIRKRHAEVLVPEDAKLSSNGDAAQHLGIQPLTLLLRDRVRRCWQ